MEAPGEEKAGRNGKHFHRYLDYAGDLLTAYKGHEPFHLYLKKYFSRHKKHGSKDRKLIAALCYGYFRLGYGVTDTLSLPDKLLLGLFLSGEKPSSLLEALRPGWNEKIDSPANEKLALVKDVFSIAQLFPLEHEVSPEVDFQKFSTSFLVQPAFYLRVRPGHYGNVKAKLRAADISFGEINLDCLVLDNLQKLPKRLEIDQEVVIQDYNSQRTGDLLAKYFMPGKEGIRLWDCCAASGGKSIMARDILPEPHITVSDSREAILNNLKHRFKRAGIDKYHSFVADLSLPPGKSFFAEKVDLLLADVPCTGSGTWGRTPEQIHFASKKMIEKYAFLQRNIVLNALPELKENGYLLYITCSVFAKENEENVAFFREKLKLELLESHYLKGYEMKADTLYAAIFRKK